MKITPGVVRRFTYRVCVCCIAINFLVKLGLIYNFQCKSLLLFGAVIDMAGVYMVARLGKPY